MPFRNREFMKAMVSPSLFPSRRRFGLRGRPNCHLAALRMGTLFRSWSLLGAHKPGSLQLPGRESLVPFFSRPALADHLRAPCMNSWQRFPAQVHSGRVAEVMYSSPEHAPQRRENVCLPTSHSCHPSMMPIVRMQCTFWYNEDDVSHFAAHPSFPPHFTTAAAVDDCIYFLAFPSTSYLILPSRAKFPLGKELNFLPTFFSNM